MKNRMLLVIIQSGAFAVLSYTLFFPALIQLCKGQSQVIGGSGPFVALVGDSLTLPCRLEPAADASHLTVEWARSDLDPRFVLVWRDGVELQSKKHPSYRDRTSVHADELKLGDISLRLSSVRLSDEGTYRCFVPEVGEALVKLVVGAASSPVITKTDEETDDGAVLECKSSGWRPEPEVLWLDAEGNPLPAGRPETVRGPDGLYTVSSRVTVENTHGSNFTCRLTQNEIEQIRETHIQLSDHSTSSAPLLVGVIVAVLLIIAVVFFLQRWRRHKKNKNHGDVETQNGEERNNCVNPEQEHLLKTETDGEKRSETTVDERTTMQEETGRRGQEEQETHHKQSNNVPVQTDGQTTTDGAELQAGTQQRGDTSDKDLSVEEGEAESDLNVRRGETTPVSHSTDPQQKPDEDKTRNCNVESEERDQNVQPGGEETEAQVQKEEENHEGNGKLEAGEEEMNVLDIVETSNSKLQRAKRDLKGFEKNISRWNGQIKAQESQISELKEELEEVERTPQTIKTEEEKQELEKKKEKLDKLQEARDRNKTKVTNEEKKKLELEKIIQELEKQREERPETGRENQEEDEDEDL